MAQTVPQLAAVPSDQTGWCGLQAGKGCSL